MLNRTMSPATLKQHQMFSVHTEPEEFNNATITAHFGFAWKKTRLGKSRDYRDVTISVSSVFQMLSVHTKTQKKGFQISQVRKVPFS